MWHTGQGPACLSGRVFRCLPLIPHRDLEADTFILLHRPLPRLLPLLDHPHPLQQSFSPPHTTGAQAQSLESSPEEGRASRVCRNLGQTLLGAF